MSHLYLLSYCFIGNEACLAFYALNCLWLIASTSWMIFRCFMVTLDKSSISGFVYSRRQPDGGFSFSATTAPCLEDTYYAVRILQELKTLSDDEGTVHYIAGMRLGGRPSMRNIYRHLYLLSSFGLKERMKGYQMRLKSRSKYFLREAYYLCLSMDFFEDSVFPEVLKEKIAVYEVDPLGLVVDESMRVILMKKLGIDFNEEGYLRWFIEAQMYDGGYGHLKKSTAFMETSYWALKALHALKSSPSDFKGCFEFINGCQCDNGGFGRQIMSLPTLEATYCATASLNILGKLRGVSYFG